jgi:opacity protein-like surface antigen
MSGSWFHTQTRFLCLVAILVFIVTVVGPPNPTGAETYIGGQIGLAFPRDVTSETITNAGAGVTKGVGVDYKTSAAFGIKLGHYLNRLRFLGAEVDYTYANPHFRDKGGVPGEHFRVQSFAFNLLARYPGEKFQPYIGIGPALMLANVNDITSPGYSTQRDSKLGINAQMGLRYLLFRNVALFGEWKYQKANFHYRETPTLNSFQAPYAAQHLMFGIAWNFESLFKQ